MSHLVKYSNLNLINAHNIHNIGRHLSQGDVSLVLCTWQSLLPTLQVHRVTAQVCQHGGQDRLQSTFSSSLPLAVLHEHLRRLHLQCLWFLFIYSWSKEPSARSFAWAACTSSKFSIFDSEPLQWSTRLCQPDLGYLLGLTSQISPPSESFLLIKKNAMQILKMNFHLQLLQNIALSCILEPILHPTVCDSHSPTPVEPFPFW